MAGLSPDAERPGRAEAPAWDRFARWPRRSATAVLAGFALLLMLAAVTAPSAEPASALPRQRANAVMPRDADLRLYDRIAARVAEGESYYRAALEEQRARDFPVRPALAVRLPTLAYGKAWLGAGGMGLLAIILGIAVLFVWWRRLGEEPGAIERRPVALLLILIGSAIALKPQYLALHEVWAGLLIALSFGLHRPGRWHAALAAAALALAVRELTLPYVLLMAALAGWRRDWRETAAWGGLAAAFLLLLWLNLARVDALLLPGDRPSPSWFALRGLAGWTQNIVLSSSLYLLPGWLAAPLALLPLIGWAGWRSAAGLTGLLLHAGYGLAFMIAGRENNFYWALIVMPTWFVGLAFMPRALRSLWTEARKSKLAA